MQRVWYKWFQKNFIFNDWWKIKKNI